MKTTISLLAVLIMTSSAIAIAAASTDSNQSTVSVLAAAAVIQDEAVPPTPDQPVAAAAVQEPVALVPAQLVVEAPLVMTESVVVGRPIIMETPGVNCCPTCCEVQCCCPPPAPTKTTFCLVDPCGCSHQACVCVPACCAGEEPCITWRNGIFGRQIATMCWKCCGHKVRVIVCRSGKVKVRD